MQQIQNQIFEGERSLYGLQDASVSSCTFLPGAEDGESALKECRNVQIEHCTFSLRYPLWHMERFSLFDSTLDESVRAALWYDRDGEIARSSLLGVKALRSCEQIRLTDCTIVSAEFGWKCRDISLRDCALTAEYAFFDAASVAAERLKFKGKYSFQYVEGLHISDSVLDTKDAFWHSRNAVIERCEIDGEYLGWYSDGLTLIDCHIKGTQPLCYCKNLRLVRCTMEDADLAFEYSDVIADVRGSVISVKNPASGCIEADSIGTVIRQDAVIPCNCEIRVRQKV